MEKPIPNPTALQAISIFTQGMATAYFLAFLFHPDRGASFGLFIFFLAAAIACGIEYEVRKYKKRMTQFPQDEEKGGNDN